MGPSLFQFCVFHDQDMKLLQRLINKIYASSPKPKPDIHFQQQRAKKVRPIAIYLVIGHLAWTKFTLIWASLIFYLHFSDTI
jgi:hypothetical protein